MIPIHKKSALSTQNNFNKLPNPLGVINQNLLLIDFSLEIYIQLEQKCQSELVEDIKKDTFRQAQCDNLE